MIFFAIAELFGQQAPNLFYVVEGRSRFDLFVCCKYIFLGSALRLLGDPILKKKAERVANIRDPVVQFEMKLLGQELDAFRTKHGYGRAMSAPQVGHSRRIIACNLGKGTFFIINPEITHKSHETFTMWDDCMSFPSLMVKVHRHRSISIKYQTEEGEILEWKHMDQAASELLQHEIDHLDGLLSIDRAVGAPSEAIISREAYELNKAYFSSLVDYVIHPTIAQEPK
jgi:peptide deformylase